MSFTDAVHAPAATAQRVAAFLGPVNGQLLDPAKMAPAADQKLYRTKG